MTAAFKNQSTDAENSKAPAKSSARDDDVKTTLQKSVRNLAEGQKNLGGVEAGAEAPVTAPLAAGK